jgi:hypothetical protein
MCVKYIRESGNFIPRLRDFPSYAEEGQDFPVKFQLCFPDVNNRRVILHGPVKCRDFLGDIMCSTIFNTKYSIYGFDSNVPEWKDKYSLRVLEPSLRVTFPKEEHKKNFLQNFYGVLMLFMYPSADIVQIQSFLDEPNNVVLIDLPSRPTPMFMSFFTFLVKIAGQPLQNHPDIVNALTHGEQKRFIELFQQFFPNKDASYFKRVHIDTFKFSHMIFNYAITGTPFSYLASQKENISYLHNNSGFFSQFGSNNYSHDQSIFRRIIGTLASKCGTEVPFKFTPLTDEELHQLVPKTQYNYRNEEGDLWLIKGDQVQKYRGSLNSPVKKESAKKLVDPNQPPMSIDQLLSQPQNIFNPDTWGAVNQGVTMSDFSEEGFSEEGFSEEGLVDVPDNFIEDEEEN